MALPTSSALPPPIAITLSQLLFLNTSTPSSTFSPVGFPEKFEKIHNLNFFSKLFTKSFINSKLINSLSVTNNGFKVLISTQALSRSLAPVSYTHLTLPTIYSV